MTIDLMSLRVAARFLGAVEKIPVYNKKKDRIVYVLPDTFKELPSTYEQVPAEDEQHIKNKGRPHKPAKPRKPKKPHKPEIPRNLTPAPIKPPRPVPLAKPVAPLKQLKKVPIPKVPVPPKPNKWEVHKDKPFHHEAMVARVLSRHDASRNKT